MGSLAPPRFVFRGPIVLLALALAVPMTMEGSSASAPAPVPYRLIVYEGTTQGEPATVGNVVDITVSGMDVGPFDNVWITRPDGSQADFFRQPSQDEEHIGLMNATFPNVALDATGTWLVHASGASGPIDSFVVSASGQATIDSISPPRALAGDVVTVSGTGLATASQLRIAGAARPFTRVDADHLEFLVPGGTFLAPHLIEVRVASGWVFACCLDITERRADLAVHVVAVQGTDPLHGWETRDVVVDVSNQGDALATDVTVILCVSSSSPVFSPSCDATEMNIGDVAEGTATRVHLAWDTGGHVGSVDLQVVAFGTSGEWVYTNNGDDAHDFVFVDQPLGV